METPQLITALKQYLGAQDDVAVAYLYGSYARGEQLSGSDVDVGVVFTGHASAEDLIFRRVVLSQELEDLIGKAVDVTDLKLASPHFNHQVLLEACLLKGKEAPERIEFEKRVRREHFDMLPYRQRYLSAPACAGSGKEAKRMVQEELVRARLRLLEGYMSDLRKLTGTTPSEYKENLVLRRYAERTLHLAIGTSWYMTTGP